jgi:putative restriction endonuclease
MKFFVAVTDNRWFEFLAGRQPDEVNFWRPRSTFDFHAVDVGAPFLFKLHSPQNFIVGGGFFVRHSILPTSLAWSAFETKNGTATFEELLGRVTQLGQRHERDPMIGCTVLAEPFFFPREQWIPVPKDWSANIVVGKTYEATSAAGSALWAEIEHRLNADVRPEFAAVSAHEGPRYGDGYLAHPRLGQGAFRVLVTDAYDRRCAITGEKTLPVLEAIHIKPYSEGGPHQTNNGLLLRSDLHILFDRGYMTITPDCHVEVSRRIKEEYENGRDYYALHGSRLQVLPKNTTEHPARSFIEWHNQNIYVA